MEKIFRKYPQNKRPLQSHKNMNFNEIVQKIEENKSEIATHGKFTDEILKKVQYKLRLDWNYYSNRMEGGTLTQSETRSIMVGNINVAGKPFKDVAEMHGHDKTVLVVLKMSRGEYRISEKRIKEIHTSIMYEEHEEKAKEIGKWKSDPNEIINYKGEKIDFSPPENVATEMHALLNRTNAYLDAFFKGNNPTIHPIEMIAQFHVDFLTIHPFYDGNGRPARILTNILLLVCGYPIIIIKEDRKSGYYSLLADIQVYGGNLALLTCFIAERVLETQQIFIDALAGKSIDEPNDLDKKLLLLEQELAVIDANDEVKIHLNVEYLTEIALPWIADLLRKAIPETQKFNPFFSGTNHNVSIVDMGINTYFKDENPEQVIQQFQTQLQDRKAKFQTPDIELRFFTSYGTFIKGGLNTFGCNYHFRVKFEHIKYEVWIDEFTGEQPRSSVKIIENLLHKPLTENDMTAITNRLTDAIYDHIDFYMRKNGLRR